MQVVQNDFYVDSYSSLLLFLVALALNFKFFKKNHKYFLIFLNVISFIINIWK